MNAIVTRLRPVANDVAESKAELAYGSVVDTFVPQADEMQRAVRCEILQLRDAATAALSRCGEYAAPTIAEVVRIGGLSAFSSADMRQLFQVRMAMHWMMESARLLERAAR